MRQPIIMSGSGIVLIAALLLWIDSTGSPDGLPEHTGMIAAIAVGGFAVMTLWLLAFRLLLRLSICALSWVIAKTAVPLLAWHSRRSNARRDGT